MYKIFLAFLVPGLIAACQAPSFSTDSPLTPVPAESRLILNEPLSIPPGKLSLWFQEGERMAQHELDRYYPHCKFETLEFQENEKIIQPDTFIIHKVVRWQDYALTSIRVASAGAVLDILADGGGGPAHVTPTTEMFLHSEQQANVYRLACSQWEDPYDANQVTIDPIRRALGNTFTLKLPEHLEEKQSAAQ
ncbi:hypothetical protein [Thiohalophilus thiocyanatoxydans]|uniref:Lipoprotein n=1 Tax=Thiohalophilus thiocyanatoxydans TaxID=381308 RepID=A0A4R8IIH7_9GAMM|nr:hypothetical protein [Thiohalophilus thiocyanatoxydans]TDY00486.1 hypothetical protein EDC23_1987 [Thiohalophilus thiocyanatoxydans]